MPNWFVNCIAAQVLVDDYGFELGHHHVAYGHRLRGRYWFDVDRNRLILLDDSVRPPLYQLHVEHVLALKLIPTEEARELYIKEVGYKLT